MATDNQTALITGGTSGIGRELAKLFAKDGYNLILVARTQADLDTTAAELQQAHGIQVTTIAKDLFEPNAAFELYDEVKAKGIQIDVLVNDAGQGIYGEFKDTDIKRELGIVQLNIASVLVLTKSFLQDMIARNEGKILNLASIASTSPGPLQSVYHGTKAFVLSWTEAIRFELEHKKINITITALMPGATDTDFFNKADMNDAKAVRDGKLDDPADVAKAGYDALMSGDDKVVAGFKNKLNTTMGNMLTNPQLAAQTYEQQKPSSEE